MNQKNLRFVRVPAAGRLARLLVVSLSLFAAQTTLAEAMPRPAPDHAPAHCAPHAGGQEMMMQGLPGDGPMAGGREHLPPYLHGIELSEAQRDKIFELQHAQAPRQREQMKVLKQIMEALHALSGSDNFEVKQARLLADKHAKVLSEVIVMHAESAAKVRALLTPEQKKQADDAKARAEKEHKHGPRHGFRPW